MSRALRPSLTFLAALWLASPAPAGEAALRFAGGRILTAPPVPIGVHTVELWMLPEADPPIGTRAMVLLDWGGRVAIRNSIAGLEYLVDLGGVSPARAVTDPVEAGAWRHVAGSFDG